MPDTTPVPSATPALTFNQIVTMVIDHIEGGYYHPKMLVDGRLKTKNPAAYSTSGETMFGLDRSAGHDLFYSTPKPAGISLAADIAKIEAHAYTYKHDAAKQFWESLDNAKAKDTWKWNYMGGDLNASLKSLAGEIMKPYFEKLSGLYLGNNAALILQDPRLTFHFAYACWNGPGWFKKFATDINTAVAAGKTAPKDLVQVAINSRMKEGLKPGSPPNALIAQGGTKIIELFKGM